MAKTERILANLPRTFAAFPRPTALFAIADGVGRVLQDAENHLVEVMKAHWVDHADRGRAEIRDLELLGSMFSLPPWRDEDRPWTNETVEEYRERLKRHVRNLLAGTATVPGVLRVTAATLAVTVDADVREHPARLAVESLRDAGVCLLGAAERLAQGRDAQPARVTGGSGLGGGIDLGGSTVLRVAVDGAGHEIDLAGAATLQAVAAEINGAVGAQVATHDGAALTLESVATGDAAELEFAEHPANAAGPLFDVHPRVATGRDARPARLEGTVDLSVPVDLGERPYLRLAVDGIVHELDLRNNDATPVTLAQIRTRVDDAFGASIVGAGPRLVLSSPTTGTASTVAVQQAGGNDAAPLLLGPNPYQFRQGAAPAPARLTGRASLSAGVDLSVAGRLAIQVGAEPVEEVDCAGADPAATKLGEIVEAINTALGTEVASHDGVVVILTNPELGAGSRLEVHEAAAGDAADLLLGLLARRYRGAGATAARLEGTVEIAPDIDLSRRRELALAVDGDAPVRVDVAGADPARTTPAEVTAAIDAALGAGVASMAGDRLVLSSPTAGAASRVHLVAQGTTVPGHFTLRTPILDEAAVTLFGAVAAEAAGAAATGARVAGTVELGAGVDLREHTHLRLAVDGADPMDVDCRGARPRVTSAAEIAAAVNAAFGPVATVEDGGLVLASPTAGAGSSIAVGTSAATDAAPLLLGGHSDAFAIPPTPVRFTGTQDLSGGVAVHERSLLALGVDGAAPIEIDLSAGLGSIPELAEIRLDAFEIARRINEGLSATVASSDGFAVTLVSPTAGPAGAIEFAPASDAARDATEMVFGIAPPRSYTGGAEVPAAVRGEVDLGPAVDLAERRHLRISVDGAAAVDVDCAGADPAATTPAEVVDQVNTVLGATVAALDGDRLVLTSPGPTEVPTIQVLPATGADAREVILGDVPGDTRGVDAQPAVLVGEATLLGALDLAERRTLRISVDGAVPVDVDAAGDEPARTFADEVVAAINAALPANPPLADLTDDRHLRLTAPESVAVLAIRHLTLHEFPPHPVPPVTFTVTAGSEFTVTSGSVDREPLHISFVSPQGVVGPTMVNLRSLATVHVPVPVGAGEVLEIWADEAGRPAARLAGETVPVEATPGALTIAPGDTTWRYTDCDDSRYDAAVFGDYFAGGPCRRAAAFDVSDFSDPATGEVAVFAGPPAAGGPRGGEITLTWPEHQPGRFVMELPADLPPQWGARFAGAPPGRPGCPPVPFAPRFHGATEAVAAGVILEDTGVDGSIVDWVNAESGLVEAELVADPPPGVTPVRAPLADPVPLAGGTSDTAARLMVFEDGLDAFVDIRARQPGEHGNRIEITLAAGAQPGSYDATIGYRGEAVFELARARVHDALVAARAAGVESNVTRRNRN